MLSLLDSFTIKQAQFLTHEENTHEILKKLSKENAFIFYDEADKVYRIHNVLLDYLRIKQHFKVEELKKLNRRLGHWYLLEGKFLIAYKYLYKAGEIEKILIHLNNPDNIRDILIKFDGVKEMFEGLSKELIIKYPIAYLQYIFMVVLTEDENRARVCLSRLDDFERAYSEMVNIEEKYRNRIIAEIMIIRKLTRFNHIDKDGKNNEMLIKLLNGESSYIMRRNNDFTFGSPHMLYCYFRDQGKFKETKELIIKRFPAHAIYSDGCGTGAEYLAVAEYSLETGDLEAAEINSQKTMYKAKTKDQMSLIICAKFNLTRLYILQGKIDKGLKLLNELEVEVSRLNNHIFNTTIDLCKGYVYSTLGQIEKAPYWLQEGDMSSADFFHQGIAFNYIVYGKSIINTKNYIKLEMLSESFVEYFSIYSNQLGFIHNSIFDAIAKYNLYGMETGINSLMKSLEKGRVDKITAPFIENSFYIFDMLEVIVEREPNNKYIKQLYISCKNYKKNFNSKQLVKVKLSQREIEVLTLAAEGLKREKIATRLVISQGTVKTHFQNIYAKLNANGKVSAIKIAHSQGII